MPEINWLAALAAAVSSFVVGGLWYSPALFGKAWQREAGVTDEQIKTGNPARIYGSALVLSIIAAVVFAMFLGPKPDVGFATSAGFAAGLCWVAASLGINYLFERKSLALFLINGGYHTVQFTVIGLVLGLWH
jgi:hypothetical protein